MFIKSSMFAHSALITHLIGNVMRKPHRLRLILSPPCPQDFEALTPNLLARTVETVEGGGMIVLLLSSLSSLSKLYTMTMVKLP